MSYAGGGTYAANRRLLVVRHACESRLIDSLLIGGRVGEDSLKCSMSFKRIMGLNLFNIRLVFLCIIVPLENPTDSNALPQLICSHHLMTRFRHLCIHIGDLQGGKDQRCSSLSVWLG